MPRPGFYESEGRLHVHAGTPEFEKLEAALRGNGRLPVGGGAMTINYALVVIDHVGEEGQPLEARDVTFKP